MSKMNRLGNAKNEFQGSAKKVLAVCSAGLLRSPTAAVVLSQPPFEFNTRSAGAVDDFALILVDDILLAWADEIVFMEKHHRKILDRRLKSMGEKAPKVVVLNIPDDFKYGDPELKRMISEAYTKASQLVSVIKPTPCMDPDKMHGAADGFPGNDYA